MPNLPERKENRLKEYDYSRAGCYFITVCTKDRRRIFWEPETEPNMEPPPENAVGADIIRPHPPVLSRYGKIVEDRILAIPEYYPNVTVDKYAIMPDHIHLLLMLHEADGRIISAPTKGISTIVGQMKRAARKCAGIPLWQKGFYDHVLRTQDDHQAAWTYIHTNPARWREDSYYTETEG